MTAKRQREQGLQDKAAEIAAMAAQHGYQLTETMRYAPAEKLRERLERDGGGSECQRTADGNWCCSSTPPRRETTRKSERLTRFPALASCTALERLKLGGTMIQGEAPAWLADLPALKFLRLPQNDGFSISPTLKEKLVVRGVQMEFL